MKNSPSTLLRRGALLLPAVAAALQLALGAARLPAQSHATLVNFNADGTQAIRLDTAGVPVDAHDGKIAYFNGAFYLYGTSYRCGYEWGKHGSPFCGFKVYSSPDLTSWTDRGFLFNVQTATWQARCNGSTYGCYRPHVVYNKKNNLYVLWINVYDNRVGYRVFTSPDPAGPFTETAEPVLARNSDAAVAGVNNGDEDVFVDATGTAYLAYTDWRAGGGIFVERLNADYTSGTGASVRVTETKTEAPGLMERKGEYYLLYSDPNCGYCSGTGTSYRRAKSALGSWSKAIKISDQSCGGQPSFVAGLQLGGDEVFLYGSDLWNHGAKNEALANYYWAPLSFGGDGSIEPIRCVGKAEVRIGSAVPGLP